MKEKLHLAAKVYNQLPLPQGYEKMVEDTIKEAEKMKNKRKGQWAKRSSIAAAALFGVFISTLNVNAQFANAVAQIPIIGGVAQLFTFNHQEESTDTYNLKVDIPQIKEVADGDYTEEVNEAIENKILEVMNKGKERAEEFKEAYVATGGKEEDFKPVKIDIDYNVTYNQEGIVSFVINHSETSASAYNEQYFYNLDLVNNKEITLEDLFGSDGKEKINESIQKQMKERESERDIQYFDDFQGITEQQNFYINAYGQPVIVFGKFEVGPGVMGIQEFVIDDVDMQVNYPEQAHYQVRKVYQEGNGMVAYPQIEGYKGELLMDYMNQSLYNVVEKYSKPSYSNLTLDYRITRMDDTVLSATFVGVVELDRIGVVPIRESINLDMAKTGQEIGVHNYIKQDDTSLAKWQEIMNEKAKEKGLVSFEAEGIRMCFKDNRVEFYYMPLDDSANQFVYITLTLEELDSLVTQEFEHIYHS